jgi:protein SCO1
MSPSSRFRLLALAAAATLLLVGASWLTGRIGEPRFLGTTYEPVAPAPDFALVDHQGRAVTRAGLAGTPTLLFFGYTRCPDVCPLTLSRLTRAARGRDVRIALVSVDPRHDTPQAMAGYVSRFGPGVIGLTGDSAAVARAMAGYGAYAMPPAEHAAHGAGGRPAELAHSSVVYGLDRVGNLRVVIPAGADPESLAADVRALSRL